MAERKQLEVKIEKKAPKRTFKWRRLWDGVMALGFGAIVVFELIMLGYNLGRHNWDSAVTDGIIATMFILFLVFNWLDMRIDAKLGRHAMRMVDDLFEAFAHAMEAVADHVEELEKAKSTKTKTNSRKKYATPEAKREAHNARRRAARAAKKQNDTPKKTNKK